RLPAPANAMRIVQDVRLQEKGRGNLQTDLSILDAEGAVVQSSVIRFNEIDIGYRKTASFSAKRPERFGFKMLNTADVADVWLTVSPVDNDRFLPFFGEIVPQPLSAGQDASGRLDAFEDVYYVASLPRGTYRAILDVANSNRDRINLQGYLAALDP